MEDYNYIACFKNIIRSKLDPTIINGGVINSLKVMPNLLKETGQF